MKCHTKWLSALCLFAACSLISVQPAQAQTHRLSLEGRLGVTLPSGDLSDADAGSGLSLVAEAIYSFSPALSGYLGLSHDRFSCGDDDFCDDDITGGGFQGGLKFLLQRDRRVLPWLRAGLIGQTLDTGDDEADLALGLEAGAGIDYDVTPRFALVPGVYFRTYNADFGAGEVAVRYFTLSLGGHIHF